MNGRFLKNNLLYFVILMGKLLVLYNNTDCQFVNAKETKNNCQIIFGNKCGNTKAGTVIIDFSSIRF